MIIMYDLYMFGEILFLCINFGPRQSDARDSIIEIWNDGENAKSYSRHNVIRAT